MLKRALPFVDNPLFRFEVRRVRWLDSPEPLWSYTLGILAVVGILVFVVWLLICLSTLGSLGSLYFLQRSNDLIEFLFIVSIAANIFLDFASLWATLNSMDARSNPLWWDLLRVTPLHPAEIVHAKHARAQVRTWWLMMMILSTRISVVLLSVLHWLFLDPMMRRSSSNSGITDEVWLVPTALVFAATYVAEPYWRARAMTAVGLWISARSGNSAMAGLVGFGAMVLVWVSQAAVMAILIFLTIQCAFSVTILGVDSNVSVISAACYFFFAFCLTAFVIYRYYRRLLSMSLNRALRSAFRD